MSIIEAIKSNLKDVAGEWSEKKGIHAFETVIAERKSFLSRKKLTYSAKLRVDDAAKQIKFTEMLKESGFGLTSGAGDGMSPGFGFKTESYNTLSGSREGSIKEQSDLFGKKYEYKFDWGTVRHGVEEVAKQNGYQFKYQITSIGL